VTTRSSIPFISIAISLGLAACGSSGSHGPNRPDLGGFIGPSEGPPPPDLQGAVDSGTGPDAAPAGCSTPTPISNGTSLTGQDTSASTDTLSGLCVYGGDGNVLYYSTTVPPGQRLSVTVTPTDGSFDPVLRLIDACGATTCDAWADDTFTGEPETLVFANSDATPRDVLLAVGGYDPGGGTFDLAAKLVALPANASCAGAKPVTPGPALTGEDASGAGSTIAACASWSDGGVLYYSRTIPARTALQVKATPTSASWDPSLRLLDTCGASSCLAYADDGYTDEPETLSYSNRATSPQPVLIAVGSGATATAGTFDLQLTETALPPPPTNTTCAMAATIADGTVLAAQDATEGMDALTSACLASASGTVLYYKTTIPAASSLEVHVAPNASSPSMDPVVRILPACGATSCLASADATYGGGEETAAYKNTGASPLPVIVAVGSYGSSSNGAFDLDAHLAALPPPPTNLSCAMATAVADGSSVPGQDQSLATVTEGGVCLSSADGGVLFYKTTVPNGQRLLARATPKGTPAWDPVVRLLSTCSATSCLSTADSGTSNATELLSYKNTSGASMPVVFTVGSYSASTPGVFDLDTWIKPPATNTTCAAALAVTSGSARPVEDGESGSTGQSSVCVPGAVGPVLFYKITIPAAKSLKVDATPLGSWDPVIRLLSSCGASTCLASQDAGNTGAAESLIYANSTGAPLSVIVSVGGYTSVTQAFDLAVSIF
jgi:hypothetical protein